MAGKTTGLVNTTDKGDFYSTIEGADAFTISKMDARFLEGSAEFVDLSAKGSDGMAYNQSTAGLWDVELGYCVAGGPWMITSKKGIPSCAIKTMNTSVLDWWRGAIFWWDNIKIEWEAGSYEVKPSGSYPATGPRKGP